MKIDCPPHYHELVLPSGRTIRTKQDCHHTTDSKLARSIALELGYGTEELGIFGIDDIIGMGAKAIGGIFGGKKKKKKKKPEPTPTVDIDAASPDEIRNIVRELLSEVPPPVRDQIRSALQEYKLKNVDNKSTITDIVSKVAKEFQPQLEAAAKLLKEGQLQRAATNEHNVIVKDDKRWQSNTDNQEKIYKRIQLLEKRIANAMEEKRKSNNRVRAAFGIPSDIL